MVKKNLFNIINSGVNRHYRASVKYGNYNENKILIYTIRRNNDESVGEKLSSRTPTLSDHSIFTETFNHGG